MEFPDPSLADLPVSGFVFSDETPKSSASMKRLNSASGILVIALPRSRIPYDPLLRLSTMFDKDRDVHYVDKKA